MKHHLFDRCALAVAKPLRAFLPLIGIALLPMFLAQPAPAGLYVSDSNTVDNYNPATGTAIQENFATPFVTSQQMVLSGNRLFVADLLTGTVSTHDATTGAAISTTFITGVDWPVGLAISGNTLLVGESRLAKVSAWNLTTGALINNGFISNLAAAPRGLAIDGNRLFVVTHHGNQQHSSVGVYNATTGATINADFIPNLVRPFAIAISGNKLYLTIADTGLAGSGSVAVYDATTGAPISTGFITGLTQPYGLALHGNDLYVANFTGGTVGKYNATTGAAINSSYITGLGGPSGLLVNISDFENWLAETGAPGWISSDPDFDGLSNEFEYQFGLNPLSNSSVNPFANQLTKTTGKLSFTRRKTSLSGLNYKLLTSTHLATWSEDSTATWLVTGTTGNVETVEVTLASPAPLTAPQLFARIKAE